MEPNVTATVPNYMNDVQPATSITQVLNHNLGGHELCPKNDPSQRKEGQLLVLTGRIPCLGLAAAVAVVVGFPFPNPTRASTPGKQENAGLRTGS